MRMGGRGSCRATWAFGYPKTYRLDGCRLASSPLPWAAMSHLDAERWAHHVTKTNNPGADAARLTRVNVTDLFRSADAFYAYGLGVLIFRCRSRSWRSSTVDGAPVSMSAAFCV